jgi:hypothetical protein
MNILATTTEVLDLLVPLEASDRSRVLRAVQAAIDLTDQPEVWKGLIAPITEETIEPIPTTPAIDRRMPLTAAPKGSRKSPLRILWATRIPDVLREHGPLSPAQIRTHLNTPATSAFMEALKDCLKEGTVEALGNTTARVYHYLPNP